MVTRKLAVILFTDIAGYSAIMQEDEEKALFLARTHEQIIQKLVLSHNGVIKSFMGDGSLNQFESVIDAMDAAVGIQMECRDLNNQIPLRIGLHLGEVIQQDDKVYGDGVNIASRIENIAIPGSIFFSSVIKNQLDNKPDYHARKIGSYRFKNINKAMDVYALVYPGLVVPEAQLPDDRYKTRKKTLLWSTAIILLLLGAFAIGKSLPTKQSNINAAGTVSLKSIAVLPFDNLTNDPEQDYYSLGLSEDIIGALSSIPNLKIAARTSSFSFKDKDVDIKEIGKKLKVSKILDGSVRKSKEDLIVHIHLIDAVGGFTIWNKTFNQTPDDIFSIQREIADLISKSFDDTQPLQSISLPIELDNVDAHNLYLKGRHFLNLRTEASLRKSVQYFEECIEEASNFAEAYVGLADAYAVLGFYDYLPPSEAFQNSRIAAKKALELKPQFGKPHATLGYIALYYDWNWSDADHEFSKAIDLDPEYPVNYQWYANYLVAMDRMEDAFSAAMDAQRLDPLNIIINLVPGWVQYHARNYEDAVRLCDEALELDENFGLLNLYKSLALSKMNNHEAALTAMDLAKEQLGLTALVKAYQAIILSAAGQQDEAGLWLTELERDLQTSYVPAFELAKAYLALGDERQTLNYLNKSYEQRSHSMAFLMVDPQLDEIRDHPEFKELARKVGFDP